MDDEEARLDRAMTAIAPVANRYDEVVGRGVPEDLWRCAVADVQAGNYDDRPLYWARLKLRRIVRERAEDIRRAEDSSRGFVRSAVGTTAVGDPGAQRKRSAAPASGHAQRREPTVLVIGFDPFSLDRDIGQSNPSGLAALALDGSLVAGARVRSAILPVRFADFDQGIVERLMTPYFERGLTLAITVSMGRDAFDLERFPGRRRSADKPDNRNVRSGGSAQDPRIPPGLEGPEFLEFALPANAMAAVGGRWGVRDNRRVRTLRRKAFDACSLADLAGEIAVEGSGGGYLSNEVSYRSLLLRRRLEAPFPTGHVHTPAVSGYDAEIEREIVDQVRVLIEAALGS